MGGVGEVKVEGGWGVLVLGRGRTGWKKWRAADAMASFAYRDEL